MIPNVTETGRVSGSYGDDTSLPPCETFQRWPKYTSTTNNSKKSVHKHMEQTVNYNIEILIKTWLGGYIDGKNTEHSLYSTLRNVLYFILIFHCQCLLLYFCFIILSSLFRFLLKSSRRWIRSSSGIWDHRLRISLSLSLCSLEPGNFGNRRGLYHSPSMSSTLVRSTLQSYKKWLDKSVFSNKIYHTLRRILNSKFFVGSDFLYKL